MTTGRPASSVQATHPVRSMTGFAAGQGQFADGTGFALTVKSVNHRFLDLAFRLPSGCDTLETAIRGLLKARIERGHVEVTLDFGRGPTGSGLRLNEEVLESMVGQLRAAAGRLGIASELELSALLRLPGMVVSDTRTTRPEEAEMLRVIVPMVSETLARFDEGREREGGELAVELGAGMGRLRAACDRVTELRAGVRMGQFERLRARLGELLAGTPVSEERLLVEAALLAEKSDVEEEAVRLRAHTDQFAAILEEGGAVGKRLDFLLQELQREANTTLSKTGSAAGPDSLRITELGLVMKAEIERAREQVQNLE